MKLLDLFNSYLQKLLVFLAAAVLICMVAITCVDIVSRKFGVPVKGAVELMGFGGAMLIAFALSYTQRMKENIAVDLIVKIMPQKVRHVVSAFNSLLCLIISVIAAYQVAALSITLLNTGELTETLRIPVYPFIFATTIGFAALALVFLNDLITTILNKNEAQP